MPRLWEETIDAHRQAVREATLDAAAALVAEHGLRGVTMSQIAREAGIGRATLYKYFPDVEAVLLAWHERHVAAHLERLAQLRNAPGDASGRLQAVLETYAVSQYERHASELAALLHRDEHAMHAEAHLHAFVGELLAEGAERGELRDDVAPGELATYCLHALGAAGQLQSKAAVRRLVAVTLDGLRRPG